MTERALPENRRTRADGGPACFCGLPPADSARAVCKPGMDRLEISFKVRENFPFGTQYLSKNESCAKRPVSAMLIRKTVYRTK